MPGRAVTTQSDLRDIVARTLKHHDRISKATSLTNSLDGLLMPPTGVMVPNMAHGVQKRWLCQVSH